MINQTYNEVKNWMLKCWNESYQGSNTYEKVTTQHEIVFRYCRGKYSKVWLEFKARQIVYANKSRKVSQ